MKTDSTNQPLNSCIGKRDGCEAIHWPLTGTYNTQVPGSYKFLPLINQMYKYDETSISDELFNFFSKELFNFLIVIIPSWKVLSSGAKKRIHYNCYYHFIITLEFCTLKFFTLTSEWPLGLFVSFLNILINTLSNKVLRKPQSFFMPDAIWHINGRTITCLSVILLCFKTTWF